jgi:Fur family iron response transcriptional regulator
MTSMDRPYSRVLDRLKDAGLRPTRQRLALAKLLAEAGDCHMTAEQLHAQSQGAGIRVSLATVYNTLHQFTEAGILREIVVDAGRSYFDTNVSDHHHFFFEDSSQLQDIDGASVTISSLPTPPAGMTVRRVDVVIRVKPE